MFCDIMIVNNNLLMLCVREGVTSIKDAVSSLDKSVLCFQVCGTIHNQQISFEVRNVSTSSHFTALWTHICCRAGASRCF